MDYEVQQYSLIMQLYDSEVSRFYTRQNLYIGIQLVIFAAILAGVDKIICYPFLLRFALIVLVFVSLMTALIGLRGLTTQKLIYKIINEIEDRNRARLDIILLAKKHSKAPLTLIFILSIILSWGLFTIWLILIAWFELSSMLIN